MAAASPAPTAVRLAALIVPWKAAYVATPVAAEMAAPSDADVRTKPANAPAAASAEPIPASVA